MNSQIPTWVLVWGVIIGLLPLAFGIQGYIDPAGHFGKKAVLAGAAIYAGPIGLYIARNMASALVTFFALFCRSAAMLIIVFALRIVTDLFDLINNIIAGTLNAEFLFFATLWIGGSLYAISKLWPNSCKEIAE